MSFVVTARKYRPQRFDQVVGQEHITVTLKNAINSGRIAHAYLFTGPRGVGKTTTARILAKSLNCFNPKDAEPCNECEMCLSIQSFQLMDIIEIDAASNRGIDEIRTLRESVKYAPTKGKYKVYIIDEVHMLTKDSFNAFLKTLEEPPSHTVFIFATTDVHRVPVTIISRCQRYDFRRIQLDIIKKLLSEIAENEKIKIDDQSLTIIAKKADGGLRDAESFFDQVVAYCGNNVEFKTVIKILNLIDEENYFLLTDAILNKDFLKAFEIADSIYKNGWNFADFLEGLIEHFRNIMTVIVTSSTNLIETAEVHLPRYLSYQDKFTEGDILRALNFLSRTLSELKFSQNLKIKVETALCYLIALEKTESITSLIEKINSGITSVKSDTKKNEYKIESSEIKSASISQSVSEPKPNISVQKPKEEQKQATLFNLESIRTKWEGFQNLVKNEKSLILGHYIPSMIPISLERDNLIVTIKDSEGKIIFQENQDYLQKKSVEIFGRKLNFQFEVDESKEITYQSEPPEQILIEKTPKISNKENTPLIDRIIKELGGKELL